MRLHWNDTETTGLSPEANEIVQLSGIIEHDGEIVEEYDIFMRPDRPNLISARALEVQGRTAEELLAFPERKLGYAEFKDLLERYRLSNDGGRYGWVGQNPEFDKGFVRAFMKSFGDDSFDSYFRMTALDLVEVARKAQRKGFYKGENCKLPTICKNLGIEYSAHDSLEDIRATRLAMRKFDEYFHTPSHVGKQISFLGEESNVE